MLRLLTALSLVALTALPASAALDPRMNGKPYDARRLLAAPDFTFPTAEGDENISLSDYKGNVRLVVFWATWCPACRSEVPDLVALQGQYGKKGLQIIALSKEDAPTVKAFGEAQGINYLSLIRDKAVSDEYGGVSGIPTTFVVGRKGYIYKHYVGKPPKALLEADIKALL